MNKILFPFYNKDKHGFLMEKLWFRLLMVLFIFVVLGIAFLNLKNLNGLMGWPGCRPAVWAGGHFGTAPYAIWPGTHVVQIGAGWLILAPYNCYIYFLADILIAHFISPFIFYLTQVLFFKVVIDFVFLGARKDNK